MKPFFSLLRDQFLRYCALKQSADAGSEVAKRELARIEASVSQVLDIVKPGQPDLDVIRDLLRPD